MKFHWLYLVVGVISLTAFAAGNPKYGKWLFAIVVLGALLLASDKVIGTVEGVK